VDESGFDVSGVIVEIEEGLGEGVIACCCGRSGAGAGIFVVMDGCLGRR
jgi:hypothetical protein